MQGLWHNIFCSQKINPLVFNWYCGSYRAFGDAQDRVTQGKKKKPKATLYHKTKLAVRPMFFMVPSYLFVIALTCHFGTSI
jgi:hypothetical protein